MYKSIAILLALSCASAFAQQTVDDRGARSTAPFKVSASEPGTCGSGEFYENSTTHKLRRCYPANTWTDVVGGALPSIADSGSAVTVSSPATFSSTVSVGTTVTIQCGGTSDRTALQAAITATAEVNITGALCLIDAPLSIPSNRTVRVNPRTTVKLANASLATAGASFAVNSDTSGGNVNIRVEGGVWDGNRANQTRVDGTGQSGWGGVGFRFNNVVGLAIRNLTIKDPTTFSMHLLHVDQFLVENITMDQGVSPATIQDGVHVNGPASNGFISNIVGNTGDDEVALNADDGDPANPGSGQITGGAITHVVIQGVHALSNGSRGVRLLSNGSALHDITVRDVTGVYNYDGVLLSTWNVGGGVSLGDFARILIENVRCTYTQHGVYLQDGHIGTVTLRDLDVTASGSNAPALTIGAAVDALTIVNLRKSNTTSGIGYQGSGAVTDLREVNADGVTSLKGAGTSTGTGFNVQNAAGRNSFFVRDDGKIGINTTSPGADMEIVNTGGYPVFMTRTNGNFGAGYQFSMDNGTTTWFSGGRKDAFCGSSGTERYNLMRNTTCLLSADANGNIKLGGSTLTNIPASAGTFVYCTDCNVASPCTGSGSGAWAFVNASGVKNCPF